MRVDAQRSLKRVVAVTAGIDKENELSSSFWMMKLYSRRLNLG